jgi:basic amino acid/polyamine antiporter, APA family
MLASVAMIINYLGSNGATVFTTLVLMTGITAAIPYGFSALAQMNGAGSTTGPCRPRALPAT